MRIFGIKLIMMMVLALLLANCKKLERDNPWDDKATLEPSEWAPEDFQAEDVSITEKKLTWTYDDKNIEGFKLDRKKGDEPWQVGLQTFDKETRSWHDSDLLPDPALTYSYRLYTYAGKNLSGEISTAASPEFPAPANLQIEKLSDISYKLTWQDNSIGEYGFKIDRKTDDAEWLIGYGTVDENITTFVDTNVFAGKSSLNLEYRVYAFYKEFESTKTDANANAALTPPTNLQINQNTITSVSLTWQDNSSGEEGFHVERKQGTGDWELLATLTGTSYTDEAFELNTNVSYRIASYYGQYASDYVESSFNSQIAAPTNLEIVQNTITSVTMSWQDNSSGEEGFRIERKQGTGNWEMHTTLTGTSYTDEAFELNTDVSYRIAAYYGQYASDYVESSFNSQIPAPENLFITQNSITSLTLSWHYNSSGEEGFYIERKQGTGNWGLLTTLTGTSYSDAAFELNTNVSYRVAAYYGQYASDYAENSFNSQIPAPENLTIAVSSYNSVTLNWTFDHIGHEGFKIERNMDNGNWEMLAGDLGSNQDNFSDDGVDLMYHNYRYRIFVFYDQNSSQKIEFPELPDLCGIQIINDTRDGNQYETVKIGNQCWMKENLKWLQSVSPSVNGSNTSAYYYVYGYQGYSVSDAKATANYQTYGVLYNWTAAMNACPAGWHLPSDSEWTVLIDHMGGSEIAGGKMKTTGTTHWSSPNTGATNSSGLSCLPGGFRVAMGDFSTLNYNGYWWASTESSTTAWQRVLDYENAVAYRGNPNSKELGFSVRCVRD